LAKQEENKIKSKKRFTRDRSKLQIAKTKNVSCSGERLGKGLFPHQRGNEAGRQVDDMFSGNGPKNGARP